MIRRRPVQQAPGRAFHAKRDCEHGGELNLAPMHPPLLGLAPTPAADRDPARIPPAPGPSLATVASCGFGCSGSESDSQTPPLSDGLLLEGTGWTTRRPPGRCTARLQIRLGRPTAGWQQAQRRREEGRRSARHAARADESDARACAAVWLCLNSHRCVRMTRTAHE